MQSFTLRSSALLAAALLLGAQAAMAQAPATTDPVPGHPRVNEVDQRLANQQNRINSGVNSGKINAKQEARDTATDNRVARQLSADEAKHGGHITKGEQTHLNKELNRDSNHIYEQKHPN